MSLLKPLKRVVLTYEDGKTIQVTNEEAKKFGEVLLKLLAVCSMALIQNDNHNMVDLDDDLEWEILRNKDKIAEAL